MSVEDKEIIIICPMCEGVGEMLQRVVIEGGVPVEQMVTCPSCNGATKYIWGSIDFDLDAQLADVVDKINDIKDKVDEIKAVVDVL